MGTRYVDKYCKNWNPKVQLTHITNTSRADDNNDDELDLASALMSDNSVTSFYMWSLNATLVRKGIKAKEMLCELEGVQIIDCEDGYHHMTEEVAQESAPLGNLREKITEEVRPLEAVL
ncbi:hypothetical protein RhiirA4_461658 [Rhizophagus irregularis]|uniref:RasGAP protein C-terminal domain-containing protein n=1 Tax=Rhizophagus irregularis TaxID=588596 RepID=A0A2I1GJB6_9GLOM|nr:hypothetical protein RhiirA4_461658 [Rhizophagus irregularis]